jgi:prenylated cyclic peptide (anacyclamide/piricyclamide family)
MTKKNIRPQQAAPVQRETVGANFSTEGKLTAQWKIPSCVDGCGGIGGGIGGDPRCIKDCLNELPFAGDEAE